MLRRFYVFVIVMLVATTAVMAADLTSQKAARDNIPVRDGSELLMVPCVESDARPAPSALDEPIGELYQAGTTWYDYQHNGSAGKMISVDGEGYVHMVWMNGLQTWFPGQPAVPRHIYYNCWDPTTLSMKWEFGTQASQGARGGYTSMVAASDGFCFPAYHESIGSASNPPHTAATMHFIPREDAFVDATQPCWYQNLQLVWPKIAQSPDGKLHVVSTESALNTSQIWQRQAYSRAIPHLDNEGFGDSLEWEVVDGGSGCFFKIDTSTTIASTIAASPVSERVAIAYTNSRQPNNDSQFNNDLWVLTSDDGGVTWNEPINVSNFQDPDLACISGDSVECNKDTLRLYTDTAVLFDQNDILHVAFTTITFAEVGGWGFGRGATRQRSGVWHWSEEFEEFSPIYNDYEFYYNLDTTAFLEEGGWQFNVQRPSMALDTSTGYLYCSLWRYEPDQWSSPGLFRMADAYVSVSCNNGRVWSQAVNVTNTDGGQATPAPGSLSERDITVADRVSYDEFGGYLHMSYVLDLDAGGVPQEEGVATLNPVYYQRVPVDSIPLRPILNPYWPAFHIDTTGFPGFLVELDTTEGVMCPISGVPDDRPTLRPNSFALYQNYPNPFNPSTKIQFDLVRDARVTLKVYNVMGQEVATLLDDKPLASGVQKFDFNGASLSSGVYVYRINVDGVTSSKKMVLMK